MTSELAAYEAAVAFCESLLRPMGESADEGALRRHFLRMGYFLDQLGRPHERFASVHVAGTSGKGSTTEMIGEILHAAGIAAGVHTTPYLQTPIERLMAGGAYASPAEFTALVDELRPQIARMQRESPYHDISYREVAAAQAFLYFAERGVAVAAVETGMGGRFDYTNHIRPLVSVIVTVDFDHVAILGPSLERIAYHKAGIIKDGTPVISGVRDDGASPVIAAEAAAHNAPLFRLQHEITYAVRRVDTGGSVIDYRSPWGELRGLRIGMLGRHQAMNAALAASAGLLLRERGLPITEQAIRQGVAAARMPARLEIVQRQPTVILDGAHNPEKMRSLAAALNDLFPGRKPVLVVGLLAAKQADSILTEVVPLARQVIATSPHVLGKPAIPPEALAEACRKLGKDVTVEADINTAIDRAVDIAGRRGLVCVTGSLYMVGQARGRWVPVGDVLAQRTSFPLSR